MIYYTSDLHVGHKNAIRFDDRPFRDIGQMEKQLIVNWNIKVRPSDHVYVLGDVFFGYKGNRFEFLSSLSGHLHLITGNHDSGLLADESAMNLFESVDMLTSIVDEGRQVVLCHYPIINWDQKHRGSYHVYGHVHSGITEDTKYMMRQERAFNCGCMINNYEPCSLSELEINNRLFMGKNNI